MPESTNSITTETQVSAGGIAYKLRGGRVFVALISVGPENRWQLPKGLVGKDESHETAALREVSEETGLLARLIEPLDKVEYWYVAKRGAKRIRYHKFVYFYLMQYTSGSVQNHDHEVNEAKWFEINQAAEVLAFKSEKQILEKAKQAVDRLRDENETSSQ